MPLPAAAQKLQLLTAAGHDRGLYYWTVAVMADWEPHLGPLWHMLGGARTTNADKRKALTVGGAFFTDCIIPYVTNQDSLTTINRASVTRRGWWLGLLLDNMGYKLPGHADFDAEKNIEDLPVIDYTGG
eukprot:SAG25_NODE_81_length_16694_cov_8.663332_20_plen_129_part_00